MAGSGSVILDPSDDPTYALITPVLNIDDANAYCKSVEAIHKSKGDFLIKTLKDSITYEQD